MVYVMLSVHVMNVLSQYIYCGSPQYGDVGPCDEDSYYIDGLSEYSSISIGLYKADLEIKLYDPSGSYLASCDEYSCYQEDYALKLRYTPPNAFSDGSYEIVIYNDCWTDEWRSYELFVSCVPADPTSFPTATTTASSSSNQQLSHTSSITTIVVGGTIALVVLGSGFLIVLWILRRKERKKLAAQLPNIDATEFTSVEAQPEIDSKSVEPEPIIMNRDDDRQTHVKNVESINQGIVTIVSTEDGNFEYFQSNHE